MLLQNQPMSRGLLYEHRSVLYDGKDPVYETILFVSLSEYLSQILSSIQSLEDPFLYSWHLPTTYQWYRPTETGSP